MDYLFYQVAAINGFDSVGHYLRARLIVNTCSTYAIEHDAGCTANFQRARRRATARVDRVDERERAAPRRGEDAVAGDARRARRRRRRRDRRQRAAGAASDGLHAGSERRAAGAAAGAAAPRRGAGADGGRAVRDAGSPPAEHAPTATARCSTTCWGRADARVAAQHRSRPTRC